MKKVSPKSELTKFIESKGFPYSRSEFNYNTQSKQERAFFFTPDGEEVLLSDALDLIWKEMRAEPSHVVADFGPDEFFTHISDEQIEQWRADARTTYEAIRPA